MVFAASGKMDHNALCQEISFDDAIGVDLILGWVLMGLK
jgi:hypothetical protein